MGCRVYEVGISYSGRTYDEGKKIGWKDGIRAIVKYNVLRRDPGPIADVAAHPQTVHETVPPSVPTI